MLANPVPLAALEGGLVPGKEALRDAAHSAAKKLERTRDLAEFLKLRAAVAGAVTRDDLIAEGYQPDEFEILLPEAIALAGSRGSMVHWPCVGVPARWGEHRQPWQGISTLPEEAEAPGVPCRRRCPIEAAERHE